LLLVAVATMLCVPWLIFVLFQIAAQAVVLVHVARGLPSTMIVIDAMPPARLAEVVILTLLLTILAPFFGELIVTLGAPSGGGGGGAGAAACVVTETPDDWAEVLPAAS
jgi:hypothetical protein